jgi:[acyl-carrier-protein] S-malonyltransferase
MKAFLFPGQGSQHMGMGREIYEAFSCARDVFQEVDEALGQNLTKMMFEGPLEDLTATENTQPALMTVSLAILRILEKEGNFDLVDSVGYVAGHSLGEYTALCAAQALSLGHTARLLKTRGQLMQQAVPIGKGAMAAILGLDLGEVEDLAQEASQGQVCQIANDNCPGQIVISGHQDAIERALELAKAKGAKRSLLLNVSAPFHCSLMQPAQDAMEKVLGEVTFQDPCVPVMDNVSVKDVSEGKAFPSLLTQQITGRVRWREGIIALKNLGVTTFVEVGAGKVLTGLSKRIDPDLETLTLNTPQDIEAFLTHGSSSLSQVS